MFTPQQRKGFSGWSISQRDAQRTGAGFGLSSTRNVKGKGIAIEGGLPKSPPPPSEALREENGRVATDGGGGSEAWLRFREAGLLDEATFEKRERETLVDRISKLEHELHEYQYTMGLLLIEKKEWASKYEDLCQTLAKAEEMLKREQAAHLIAFSEVEKREDNLRKALGLEKQSAANLEKSLHEVRTKSSDLINSSDEKFAEARALIADIEDRKLEAERKLHAADAKMAEASRKNSEMERKLRELEARESLLHKELSSIKAENEEQEASLVKQREYLQEWEMKLQEGQESLIEGQRLLNYREERANNKDMVLDQKEKHLDDTRKIIEIASLNLEKLEDDINKRIKALAVKEKEAADKKQDLETKEQELCALEWKLNEREAMETQKLIDEHNVILNMKKHAFDLELDEIRKSVEEELVGMQHAIKGKEDEIKCKEEKIVKREQSVEKKMEKLKEKEREHESKSKALNEREKLVKSEKKFAEAEEKKIGTEKHDLIKLKAELDKDRAILMKEKQQILQDQDNLEVTEEDRAHLNSLQSKLRLEIESYNHEKASLLKERADLKQERANFEREWEALDEKRVDKAKELTKINQEKEQLEKWKFVEEEYLKDKKLEMESYIQRELESLRLKKEAFEKAMEHDHSEMLEKALKDHDNMLHSFELRSQDLEIAMQRRREDMEKLLPEKQRSFEEETENELMHINFLKEQAQKGMEELKLEWQRLKRERQDIDENRKHIEQDQLEIHNDINELNLLSGSFSNQREIFMKERARFLTFIEENRSCRNCGVTVHPDLQNLTEIKDLGPAYLPGLIKGNSKYCTKEKIGTSGNHASWFHKCTLQLFNISPQKKTDDPIPNQADVTMLFPKEYHKSSLEILHKDEGVSESSISLKKSLDRLHQDEGVPGSSIGLVSNSYGIERLEFYDSTKQMENEHMLSIDEQSYAGQTQATSEALSTSHENGDTRPPSSIQSSKHRPGKKTGLRGTRSLKRVVEEAKAFLGEAAGLNENEEKNWKAEEPPQSIESGKVNSHRMAGRNKQVGRKRQHALALGTPASSQDVNDNEDLSDSITTVGQQKRQQTIAPEPQTPGERRYNFRRSTIVGTPGRKAFPDRTAGKAREGHINSTSLPKNDGPKGNENSGKAATSLKPDDASPVACKNDKDSYMLQKTAMKSVAMNDDHGDGGCQMTVVAEVADVNQGSEGGVDTSCSEEEEEKEEEEEEETNNDGASIAKKVLRFFMT